MYQRALPKLNDINKLAGDVPDYPVNGLSLKRYATDYASPDAVTSFLKLFSDNIIFTSRTDLLEHCRLLISLLGEEKRAAPEFLRSPQG